MTWLEQSGYLWQQCELYHNNQQIRECIADAQAIQQHLADLSQALCHQMMIGQVLQQVLSLAAPDELALPLKTTLSTIKKLQSDWEVKRSGVKQRSSYANAISALEHLNQQLTQRHQQAWQTWITAQKAQIDIEPTFLSMPLPHLSQQIERYQVLYQRLNVKHPPQSSEEFAQIQQTLQELQILHSSMDFKIPEAVQQFFEILNRSAQIPMSCLSDEVWVWLRQKNLLNLFMIRKAK